MLRSAYSWAMHRYYANGKPLKITPQILLTIYPDWCKLNIPHLGRIKARGGVDEELSVCPI